MAYIRQSQNSEYIDCLDDSRQYLYDNGHSIAGTGFTLDYGEWIFAICKHAELAGIDPEALGLERALENHYAVRSEETAHVGPRPEMAHVVAQHLDSRLDGFELPDEFLRFLNEYSEEAFVACPECGTEWRPSPYITDMQGDLCRDCYGEQLREIDVSCDVSEMWGFVRQLPDDSPPSDEQDDKFYALTMEEFTQYEGEERNALAHQLGEAADEMMDAAVEERPVDKEYVFNILDRVADE